MFFIGQDGILKTLGILLPHIYSTKTGHAFLLRGPSGYGKTELALKICNYLAGTNYSMCLGDKIRFDEKSFVNFIDEIHLCKEPEILYPIIDANNHVFVFATNHDSVLPEALSNRCTNLLFTDYTDDELIKIFKRHCATEFPDDVIRYIIGVSGRNPRIMIKTYAQNLYLYYLYNKKEFASSTTSDFIEKIESLHNIEDGIPPSPRRYLDLLSALGGRASLSLISSMLHLDVETVKREIEPFLLSHEMIKITPKGRILCKLDL